jgi:hypothetical protein
MSCQGRWPCCCNRASQCLGCDSDPTGGEYEYVVLVRFGARESSSYNNPEEKYLPDFDFSSPERFLSLKLNGQDLPIPHLVDRDEYNNDYFYWWYWNAHYYSWAVYYTNPSVLSPLVNATRCPCLNDITTLYGWTYYWLYSGWYNGPEFLSDPSTQYIPIGKGAFQANNNEMDFRFSSSPFVLDEWPTQNPLKTANADINFVVIRFKNGIPECVSSKSKLSAEIRSQEYDYSSNYDGYYYWWGWNDYWWGYWWGMSVSGAYLPGSNQPLNTLGNCRWPFPNYGYNYNYWYGWYNGYYQNSNRSVDKYWGKGAHTYFDLCAYDQDSLPPCGGNLPGTLNVTVVTKCLGTQSAQVSVSTPLFNDYENTQVIPYSYTNCGNFTEIQSDISTYYMFAHARYTQPYVYSADDLAKKLRECNFPLSYADASYYIINKIYKDSQPIDLGVPEGQQEYLLTSSVYEYFIDDGNYFAEPQNPVIPDFYKDANGNISPRSSLIQSWKIGDPYYYWWYNWYYNTDYDLYHICEDGVVDFKNKHDNISYNDWPFTVKDGPILCNPLIAGPARANSRSYHYAVSQPIVIRFQIGTIYDGRKTMRYGNTYVNGQWVSLKYRPWELYGINRIWSTNCHSCELGYRTAHPLVAITP